MISWRQRPADRVQDAAALRHVKTDTQTEEFAMRPVLVRVRAIYQKLLALDAALTNHDAPRTPLTTGTRSVTIYYSDFWFPSPPSLN